MNAAVLLIQDLAVILISAALGGWLCRRLGLSPIVGYLGAGLFIGSPGVTFLYVTDPERIQILSQVGMVFLMFSIGLGIRLRQLKEMGFKLVLAVALIALLVFSISRSVLSLLGAEGAVPIFMAAMLIVSSSAVIGKVLQETNRLHDRFGRISLAVTLLEDFVAVIMLAFLGSYAAGTSGGSGTSITLSVGLLMGFIILVLIPGLVWLPWLLRKWQKAGSGELETILVAGLLFSMALITVKSGYSLALGAFLCGILMAESKRGEAISKSFVGTKDLFATVFFVAVGMSIDVNELLLAWRWIAVGVVLAFVLRSLAAFCALILVCEDHRDAIRAAVTLTAIGEFSFIIAAIGVNSGVLDSRFQAVAVGISFITTLITPALSVWVDRYLTSKPAEKSTNPIAKRIEEWFLAYRSFWQQIDLKTESAIWWRLIRTRLLQLAAEWLFLSALLAFAGPLQHFFHEGLENLGLSSDLPGTVLYGMLLVVAGIPALVALIRNGNAIIMIISEATLPFGSGKERWRDPFALFLKSISILFLVIWFANLLPWQQLGLWGLLIAGAVLATIVFLGWRWWIRLHSNTEAVWKEVLAAEKENTHTAKLRRTVEKHWNLKIEDLELAENFAFAGRTINDLSLRQKTGVTILLLERHGIPISNPGPQTHLYGGDRLLLLGSPQTLPIARQLLLQEHGEGGEFKVDSVVLQTLTVGEQSGLAGRRLRDLNWPRLFAIQIAAIRRHEQEPMAPDAQTILRPGDEILLAGSESHLADFSKYLESISE